MPAMTSLAALTLPLDVARLPPLELVPVDYEAERAKLLAGVVSRMRAWGYDFDAVALASDPAMALIEEFAFRLTLALQGLNDAGKRMSLPYSYGAALDHIAATYYADADAKRLDGEPDERFVKRLLLAAHARSPGTLEGYEYWALTFGARLADARALNYVSGLVPRGDLAIILVGARDLSPDQEAAQVALASAGLNRRGVVHASDRLIIRAANRTTLDVSAVLGVGVGPDDAAVLAEARRALSAYAAERRGIGKKVTLSGLHAALTVGGVENVRLTAPVADVNPGLDGIVELGELTLATELA